MPLQRILLCFAIMSGLTIALQAQPGLSASWRSGEFTEWPESTAELTGYEMGGQYNLSLLDNRIGLTPSLLYVQMNDVDGGMNGFGEIQLQSIQFSIPFRFYFINFLKDCDCPTFGKKNGPVNSKLFFETGPVGTVRQIKTETQNGDWNPAWLWGFGLGIHIDALNPIRFTPVANIDYSFDGGTTSSDLPSALHSSKGLFVQLGVQFSYLR